MEEFRKQIDEFATWEKGWDTYDAEIITKTAIQTAHEILEHLPLPIDRILATPNGGIAFFFAGYGYVDVNYDGELCIILLGKEGGVLEYNEENLMRLRRINNVTPLV